MVKSTKALLISLGAIVCFYAAAGTVLHFVTQDMGLYDVLRDQNNDFAHPETLSVLSDGGWEIEGNVYTSPVVEDRGVKCALLLGGEVPCTVKGYRDGVLAEEGRLDWLGEYYIYRFAYGEVNIDRVEFVFEGNINQAEPCFAKVVKGRE